MKPACSFCQMEACYTSAFQASSTSIGLTAIPWQTENRLSPATATATATATAKATATATPPNPTPTITPNQCSYIFFDEKFDGVTAPALPPGWVSSFTPGPANCTPTGTCPLGTNWATTTMTPQS